MQNQNDNVVIVFNKSISLIEKFLNTKFYALQVPLSWKSRDPLFLGEKAAILPSGVHVTAVKQGKQEYREAHCRIYFAQYTTGHIKTTKFCVVTSGCLVTSFSILCMVSTRPVFIVRRRAFFAVSRRKSTVYRIYFINYLVSLSGIQERMYSLLPAALVMCGTSA